MYYLDFGQGPRLVTAPVQWHPSASSSAWGLRPPRLVAAIEYNYDLVIHVSSPNARDVWPDGTLKLWWERLYRCFPGPRTLQDVQAELDQWVQEQVERGHVVWDWAGQHWQPRGPVYPHPTSEPPTPVVHVLEEMWVRGCRWATREQMRESFTGSVDDVTCPRCRQLQDERWARDPYPPGTYTLFRAPADQLVCECCADARTGTTGDCVCAEWCPSRGRTRGNGPFDHYRPPGGR